jgi:hypothetical protein
MLGCSYAEAAAICGCPVGTIRSRVARAREDLDAMTADPDVAPRSAPACGTATEQTGNRTPLSRSAGIWPRILAAAGTQALLGR